MSMKKGPGPPLDTFIIRLWREMGPDGPRWRGQVQHVQTGERISFADERTMLAFIRRWVKMPTGERGR